MALGHTTFMQRRITCGRVSGRVVATPTNRSIPFPDPLAERSLRVWSAGDYDRISAGFRHEAAQFVKRLGLVPAMRVLDVACGSGNITIPAARTGAIVTGLDLVPSLLETAAAWANLEALNLALDEGNAEELPYSNAQFDVVMSMFGLMFAARPDRVMSELARVTRSGGRVALANWTRDGLVGQLLLKHLKAAPPPADLPSVLLWGDETVIRERFNKTDWSVVATTRRTLTFRYPHTPAGTAELFRTAYGPTVKTMEAVDEDRRVALAAELADQWMLHQKPGATGTVADSEYLEVIATRR